MIGFLSVIYLGACAISGLNYANTKQQIANYDYDSLRPWKKYSDEAHSYSIIDGNYFDQLKYGVDRYWNVHTRPFGLKDIKLAIHKSSPRGQDICMKYLKERGIKLEFSNLEIDVFDLHDFIFRHSDEVNMEKLEVDNLLEKLYEK